MLTENRNRSFYLKITQKTLILIQICVCPDNQRSKKSEKYKWFSGQHLVKLLTRLQDIALARILSGETMEVPRDVKEIIQGPESNFHMLYTFKNGLAKQYVLTKCPLLRQNQPDSSEKPGYSGGGYLEFFRFPEKLVVFTSLEPIKLGVEMSSQQVPLALARKRKEKSKYFKSAPDNSKLTSSAVKKQANLQSIVNKMKSTAGKDNERTITNTEECHSQLVCTSTKISEIESDNLTIQNHDKFCKQDLCSLGNTGSISRKRMRKNTEDLENTSSETQSSEKEDFVSPKKHILRTKRQKFVHKDSKEGSKEAMMNRNLVDSDSISSSMYPSVNDTLKSNSILLDENGSVDSRTNSEQSWEKTMEFNDKYTAVEGTRDIPMVVEEEKNCEEHETITISDVVPCFDDIKEVSEITNEHIEYLVQKLQKKLKNIFKGKQYCRRHEDYKRGGRSKGDLAFQVRFGLYSEDQHDAIMQELMSIFCTRHNKYIDYLSKVLLPEAFVLIYQEIFGGNHDEVERKLMGLDKKEIDTTTDASLMSD